MGAGPSDPSPTIERASGSLYIIETMNRTSLATEGGRRASINIRVMDGAMVVRATKALEESKHTPTRTSSGKHDVHNQISLPCGAGR